MSKVKMYNQKCVEVGDAALSDKVFGVNINEGLVHQAAVAQMSNERQVIAHTKDRSEVRGGGKKPWKQKGTGRARAGSTRSPIWIGGGVTFGPRNSRNFKKNINLKMKRKALSMVLSDRLSNKNLAVLDKFEIKEFKTKEVDKIADAFYKKLFAEKVKKDEKKKNKPVKRNLLFITDLSDEKLKKSAGNLLDIKVLNINNINIVDLLKYKNLVITVGSVKNIEKNLSK